MTTMARHLTPVTDTHTGDDHGYPIPRDDDAERAVLAAMLTNRRAIDDATGQLIPADFYRPSHELIYDAILNLTAKAEPVDTITVADHLNNTGNLTLIGGRSALHDLANNAPYGDIGYHIDIIRDRAQRRAYINAGIRIITAANTPTTDPHDIAHTLTDELNNATAARTTAPIGTPIDLFLATNEDDDAPCWLSPGFLERQDRLIVTAGEGTGKSTLLRQWAVQLATGIHPFTLAPTPPIRVVLLDLENSERQIRRKLRPLAHQAHGLNPDNLIVVSRPEGIDLTTPTDRAWLDTLLDQTRPDVLIGGPIYKMAGGNPNDEVDAKPAAMALDRARTRYDCALVLEAHQKKSPDGKESTRAKEPFGWSGWMRWPEFGIHLAKGGDITHWRGMRDERDFPQMLSRGGVWPWSPVMDPDEELFQRISNWALANEETSFRRMHEAGLGAGRTKISHLLNGRFSQRWEGIRHRIEGTHDE